MNASSSAFPKPFRIAYWPDCGTGNPYQRLFYNALKFRGVDFWNAAVIDERWLKNTAHELDAIHIHWPEGLWRQHGPGPTGAAWGVIGLWRFLRLAKRLGLKRIWTVHNLEHHEGVDWIDCIGYRTLAKESDLLICHSHGAAKALLQRDRPKGRVVMMPHGNYDGIYPSPRPRDIVLKELGLNPERPVVCCVGMIRHYKGVDVAVNAMRSLSGQIQIIIGGLPHLYDTRGLANSQAGLNGTALVARTLSEQEFADIVGASEAVLLPYRKITGSGTLLAALTFCSASDGIGIFLRLS